MNIKEMSKEDLELLSYADIAYELLKSERVSKTTPVLFDEICKLLEIDDDTMMNLIGDFYTNLTTDKRFILIDTKWDLKEFHVVKPVIDDDDEEDFQESSDEVADTDTNDDDEEAEDTEDDDFDEAEDTEDDGYDDLSIVNEDELEE